MMKGQLLLQPVIKVTIHFNIPPVLTHRQADQCKCAFVRGQFKNSHVICCEGITFIFSQLLKR